MLCSLGSVCFQPCHCNSLIWVSHPHCQIYFPSALGGWGVSILLLFWGIFEVWGGVFHLYPTGDRDFEPPELPIIPAESDDEGAEELGEANQHFFEEVESMLKVSFPSALVVWVGGLALDSISGKLWVLGWLEPRGEPHVQQLIVEEIPDDDPGSPMAFAFTLGVGCSCFDRSPECKAIVLRALFVRAHVLKPFI